MTTARANPSTALSQLAHTRGGFVHVPWLPGQGTPAMAQADVTQGLKKIVRLSLDFADDNAMYLLSAGATH
jgi:pyroglutamyl-peptidase